ncbi:MAG: glycerol-3-phosphate 1-O-acyltransferase PlsY [Thermoleophilia bacterium]
MNIAAATALIIGAYLLGSIPFAIVIGRGIYHTDVRRHGSGNIGTTNVFRVLGVKAGILVFAGDFLKGFIPTYLATLFSYPGHAALVSVIVAGAAIVGHTWSIFLRGKGGKGVATGGGAIVALMPLLFLVGFAMFWLMLLLGRFVSFASLCSALTLSVMVVATGQPTPYTVFTLFGTAVIFYAHRSNIRRLIRGRENAVRFPWDRR